MYSSKRVKVHPFANSFRSNIKDSAYEKKCKEMDEALTSFYKPNAGAHQAVMDALQNNVLQSQRLPALGARQTKADDNAKLRKHGNFLMKDIGLGRKGTHMANFEGAPIPLAGAKRSQIGSGKTVLLAKQSAKPDLWKDVTSAVRGGSMETEGFGSSPVPASAAPVVVGGSCGEMAHGGAHMEMVTGKGWQANLAASLKPAMIKTGLIKQAAGSGKRAVSEKTSARNAKVKEIMKSKGISMIEASKYLKENPRA